MFISEERRRSYQQLNNSVNPEKNPMFFRRIMRLRKDGKSDTEIGQIIGNALGTKSIQSYRVRAHLNKFKDHPDYVSPTFKSLRPNKEELISSVLKMRNQINPETKQLHSASTIAAAHGITKNKVIGIWNRHSKIEEEVKMQQNLLEGRIKNIVSKLAKKRKATPEDKITHAETAYKRLNLHLQDLKRTFAGEAHPEVQSLIDRQMEHTNDVLNSLNKIATRAREKKKRKVGFFE